MISPLSFPLIKTGIACAVGIVLHEYVCSSLPWSGLVISSALIFIGFRWLRRFNFGVYPIESFLLWILFISAGGMAHSFGTPELKKPSEGSIRGSFWCERVQRKEKLLVADGCISDGSTTFKVTAIFFTLRADTLEVQSGRTYQIEGELSCFKPPKNPFEFDQQTYQESHGFAGQLLLKSIQQTSNILEQSAKTISNAWIQEQFSAVPNKVVQSLLVGFTTGDKSSIPKKVKSSFGRSGIMHLLAVSGLHVGLIAGLPLFLLKRSRRKWLRFCWFSIALLACWSYAWLTGFQASVLRASTMLSLLGLAAVLNVKTSSVNQLGAAATFMLLLSPQSLFSVGFQLSFSAVAAILIWSPILSKRFRTKKKWINKLVSGLGVSTSAQAGSGPLSVYYFHNFPMLFLPANMVAIPLATMLLYGALLILVLGSFNIHLAWLNQLTAWLGEALLYFAEWIGHFESASISGLFLSITEVILLYVWLYLFFLLISLPRALRSYRMLMLTTSVLFICMAIRSVPFTEITLFTDSHALVVGWRTEKEAFLIAEDVYRKNPSKGWVERYDAEVIVLVSDTVIDGSAFIWKQNGIWGINQFIFSELTGQKKSVTWDGITFECKRQRSGWSVAVPMHGSVMDTIFEHGSASTYLLNSNGSLVEVHNQHNFPIAKYHSMAE